MWTVFLGPRGEERGQEEEEEEDGGGDSDHDSGIEVSREGGRKEVLEFGSIEDLADRTAGALLAYEMRLGMDEPCSLKCESLVFKRMSPPPPSFPYHFSSLLIFVLLIQADVICYSLLSSEVPFSLRSSTRAENR